MRSCGDCNACCVYPAVPEIGKPAGEACRFLGACGHGCTVYAQRPQNCRAYSCAWLEGHGAAGDRPGDVGVLVDRRDTQYGTVLVARALEPGGAETRAARKAIKRMSRDVGAVCLVVSDEIEDNQRVQRILGAPGPMAAFRAANPDVRVYADGVAKQKTG